MITLESIAAGTGTAAGAVCPTFALATSHTAVASIGAFIAGGMAAPIFLTIFGLFVYFSYEAYVYKKAEAEAALIEKQKKFSSILLAYLMTLTRKSLLANPNINLNCLEQRQAFVSHVQAEAMGILSKNNKFPINLPRDLIPHLIGEIVEQNTQKNENLNLVLTTYIQNEFTTRILKAVQDTCQDALPTSPLKNRAWDFCKSFFPIYGSVSGGTTGVAGILYAMGLFSGFATAPLVVGGIIIGVSLIIAAIGGGLGTAFSKNLYQKNQLANKFIAVNNGLDTTNYEWNKVMDDKIKYQRKVMDDRIKDQRKNKLGRFSRKRKSLKMNIPLPIPNRLTLFCCRRKFSQPILPNLEDVVPVNINCISPVLGLR